MKAHTLVPSKVINIFDAVHFYAVDLNFFKDAKSAYAFCAERQLSPSVVEERSMRSDALVDFLNGIPAQVRQADVKSRRQKY